MKKGRVQYNDRDDLTKIRNQWTKLSGLHDRTDWSAAVVRAATATEITANYAIRQERAALGDFDEDAVNKELMRANGLKNKMTILIKLVKNTPKYEPVKGWQPLANEINEKRNGIVHRGEFCTERQSDTLIQHCETFVHGIVQLYQDDFKLKERRARVDKRK